MIIFATTVPAKCWSFPPPISKIFDNRDFGFIKLVVERPLRLNFQASPERIARLSEQNAFAALAESKKRKNRKEIVKEVEAGKKEQADIERPET